MKAERDLSQYQRIAIARQHIEDLKAARAEIERLRELVIKLTSGGVVVMVEGQEVIVCPESIARARSA